MNIVTKKSKLLSAGHDFESSLKIDSGNFKKSIFCGIKLKLVFKLLLFKKLFVF